MVLRGYSAEPAPVPYTGASCPWRGRGATRCCAGAAAAGYAIVTEESSWLVVSYVDWQGKRGPLVRELL